MIIFECAYARKKRVVLCEPCLSTQRWFNRVHWKGNIILKQAFLLKGWFHSEAVILIHHHEFQNSVALAGIAPQNLAGIKKRKADHHLGFSRPSSAPFIPLSLSQPQKSSTKLDVKCNSELEKPQRNLVEGNLWAAKERDPHPHTKSKVLGQAIMELGTRQTASDEWRNPDVAQSWLPGLTLSGYQWHRKKWRTTIIMDLRLTVCGTFRAILSLILVSQTDRYNIWLINQK